MTYHSRYLHLIKNYPRHIGKSEFIYFNIYKYFFGIMQYNYINF